VNRIQTLRAGSARTATIAAAIRAAADDPGIAVVRLQLLYTRHDRPYRHVVAYDAQFQWHGLTRDAIEAIDLLIRSMRPDIDWRQDHDWHLDTGMLRHSPDIAHLGSIPETDRTFGGTAPVFLIDAAPAAVAEARGSAA